MDFFQGQTVEMIIVIMGDDDQVNMGKILDRNPGFHVVFRARKTDGRCSPGQVRIGQNVETFKL